MSQQNYISKYSNDKFVSAAQYITELICERKALKDKKDLHYRFWLNKEWANFFRNQIGSAHKLLKKYNEKAIVNALISDQGKKIFSLRAPHLPAMIEEHQKILDSQNTKLTQPIERKDNVVYSKKRQSKKGIISKLEELE